MAKKRKMKYVGFGQGGRRKGPSATAKKKYVGLLLKAYHRFQPGGKGYKALKSHGAI